MILANSKFATIPSHFDLFKIIFFENDVSFLTVQYMVIMLTL